MTSFAEIQCSILRTIFQEANKTENWEEKVLNSFDLPPTRGLTMVFLKDEK
jgi:hypothetical protein